MGILYIAVVDRKIEIHTTNGIFKGSMMDQLDRILSEYGFEKVDQSILVNMNNAISFDPNKMKIIFENGDHCYSSRRNRHKVLSYFNKNIYE